MRKGAERRRGRVACRQLSCVLAQSRYGDSDPSRRSAPPPCVADRRAGESAPVVWKCWCSGGGPSSRAFQLNVAWPPPPPLLAREEEAGRGRGRASGVRLGARTRCVGSHATGRQLEPCLALPRCSSACFLCVSKSGPRWIPVYRRPDRPSCLLLLTGRYM